MRRRSRIAFFVFFLSFSYLVAQAMPPEPPAPPAVEPVVDDYFGTPVTDPYRYFENLEDPRVRRYLSEQGEYTRERLESLPSRARLLAETLAANQAATVVTSLQPA